MKHRASASAPKALKRLLRRGGSLALLLSVSSLWAQVERRQQPEPASEFESVPFSSVIRDREPLSEGFFKRINVGPSIEPTLGAGGQADISIGGSLRPFANPFQYAERPEDAEIKVGPLYLDVRSLSGGILYSDNIRRAEVDEEDGAIAILRLHMTVLLQLTDNLRIAVSGVLVYLPFQGEIGIASGSDFFARFDYGPLGRAQVSYDLKLGDWELLLYDDLSLRHIRASESIGFDYFEDFEGEDRAGRYVYRQRSFSREEFSDRDRRGLDDAFFVIRNVVGASATTVLPTVTRLTLGADHQNFWYIDRPSSANLLSTRDQFYGSLVSERETMRFKPYATFRTWITDLNDDWRREAHVGFFGPITENLHIRSDVGHFSGDNSRDSLLWLVRLVHTPHPQMYHRLEYSKRVTDFDEDLRETVSYHMRYRFSEDIFAELFGIRSEYGDADARVSRRQSEEYRAGIRFTYDLARRTTFRIGTVFTHIETESPRLPDIDRWTSRAELLYRYSLTLHARLTYQHEIRDSDLPLNSYEENLVMLTLTKYF